MSILLRLLLFKIILNGTATFNHSNINLPLKIDKYLRWVLITPGIHRIHHSTVQSETDSNYGFSISLWDRIFKTYVAEPKKTQTTLDIGLPEYRIQKTGRTGLFLIIVASISLSTASKKQKR